MGDNVVIGVVVSMAVSFAAAVLVFYSWRSKRNTLAAETGWLLAFGSAVIWALALGAEFGITYAIMVFICLVWVTIAFTIQAGRPEDQSVQRPYKRLSWPAIPAWYKHAALFLLSVPAAGVITGMLSVALVLYPPWTMPVKFAVAIFLYPVLWGGLCAWICAQDKLLKPALASAGLLVVGSLVMYL